MHSHPDFIAISERLDGLRVELIEHPLYTRLENLDQLRVFMEHHIFAVWDFMSLLKGLQRRISCIEVPWTPSESPNAARLVNEIVVAEESDEDGDGGFISHFAMYRNAMVACGANTDSIDKFVDAIQAGVDLSKALQLANTPQSVQHFVQQTFSVIESGDICAMVSAFTFGREDLLPDLFQQIVDRINGETSGCLEPFQYYLQRHIEVDGDTHGPMAAEMLAHFCGNDPSNWKAAETAAIAALEMRRSLWNGTLTSIEVVRAA
jgi:Protein of unknown function (DUF3050)